MTVVKEWFQLLQSAKRPQTPKQFNTLVYVWGYTFQPYKTASQEETA
jgi:hypothetical protein